MPLLVVQAKDDPIAVHSAVPRDVIKGKTTKGPVVLVETERLAGTSGGPRGRRLRLVPRGRMSGRCSSSRRAGGGLGGCLPGTWMMRLQWRLGCRLRWARLRVAVEAPAAR